MAPDMSRTRVIRAIPLAAALAALFAAPAAMASNVDPWDGNWHSSLTIYGWLPGIDADISVPEPSGTAVSRSSSDILDNLSGALMFSGDIRKGDWGFYGDIDWVKFTNQDGRFREIGGANIGGTATLDTSWNFKGGMATLAGLYSFYHGPNGYTDFIFGGRYLWVKTNVKWDFTLTGNAGNVDIANSGHVSDNAHYSNGIIGLRGRWQSDTSGWYIPYYVDIGTGDSDFTSEIYAGVGYAFGWGDLGFDWRWVRYDQGGDELVQNVTLTGPEVSLTWRF